MLHKENLSVPHVHSLTFSGKTQSVIHLKSVVLARLKEHEPVPKNGILFTHLGGS